MGESAGVAHDRPGIAAELSLVPCQLDDAPELGGDLVALPGQLEKRLSPGGAGGDLVPQAPRSHVEDRAHDSYAKTAYLEGVRGLR